MIINHFNLYCALFSYGINPEIIELIPDRVVGVQRYTRKCNFLQTVNGVLALWIHQGQEAGLAFQNQILGICQQQHVKGFLYPLTLKNGCTYAKMDEKSWFYVTEWMDFKKILFRNRKHIYSIIDLLINFRKAILNLGLMFCLPERKESRDIIEKAKEAVANLYSFKMLAEHRLKQTWFDKLYLQEFPKIFDRARRGCDLLCGSAYLGLKANMTTQNMIIYNISRGNFRIVESSQAYCLELKDFRWDLPVIDLAELLIKTGRTNKWEMNWFKDLVAYYQSYLQISSEEMGVIKAYLHFPWNIYRLAARYYFNKVDWSVFRFVEKMERLIIDEKLQLSFITNLKEKE